MLEERAPYRLLLMGVVACPFLVFYPDLKLLTFFFFPQFRDILVFFQSEVK